jgi:hypothetical protein
VKKGLFYILFCIGLAAINPDLFGQEEASPFNGIIVREIPIEAPANVALIDAQLLDNTAPARCWRVYACLDDPLWEVMAIFSNPLTNDDWLLSSSSSKFYHHEFVNPLTAHTINPVFYSVFPEAKYDSWFTINAEDNSTGMALLIVESGPGPMPSSPPLPLTTWNTNGLNLAIDSLGSYGGCVITNITTSPTISGMPDENGEVLLGQFTTDGDLGGKLNLQFRKMADSNGTVFIPLTITQELGIEFSSLTSPDACGACPGDHDQNGAINVADLLLFVADFGMPCDGCSSDMNSDSDVNTSDLLLFTAYFGVSCN